MDGTQARLNRRPLLLLLALALGTAVVTLAPNLGHGPGAPAVPPGSSSTPATLRAAFPIKPPPPGRQLLWFAPGADQVATQVRLRALDWNEVEVGTMAVACLAPCTWDQSPDGQRMMVGELPAGSEPPAGIFDTQGRQLATLSGRSWQWADDSRHLCSAPIPGPVLPPASGPSSIQLRLADSEGGLPRMVTTIVGPPSGTGGGQFWQLLTCSVTTDRALLILNNPHGVMAVRLVRLSTGRMLYSRDVAPTETITQVVANHDASVVVENLDAGARFRDLTTGATRRWPSVAAMPFQVTDISWNGQRALTIESLFSLGGAIAELVTGHRVWRTPGQFHASAIAARPGGDDFLVLITSSAVAVGRELIVRSDGSQVGIPTQYL